MAEGKTKDKAAAAGAKVPGDNRAARRAAQKDRKARNVRVLPGEVRLDWDGDEYVLEPDVIDDVDFILELEQGKNLSAIIRLLGPGQWETFKAAHREGSRVPMSEAELFLEALLEELQQVTDSGN